MSGFPYRKILLIGATSGIGKGLADKFISEGKQVVAVGRRQENLDALVKEHGSSKVFPMVFDISNLSNIRSWAVQVHDTHPDLDCVIINSGIQRGFDFSRPETVDLSVVETEFTTNYLAYIHLAMAFLPFLQLQSKTTSVAIAFTTSGLSMIPLMRCANYCASKAALHHWILVLREQLKSGPGNVKVIELAPPAVQTELHDKKHQPDIEDGRSIGITLDEYISKTWEGLVAGKEQIPVGTAAMPYAEDGFETRRQQAFKKVNGL